MEMDRYKLRIGQGWSIVPHRICRASALALQIFHAILSERLNHNLLQP